MSTTANTIANLKGDKTSILNQLGTLAMKPLNEERARAIERLEERLAEIDQDIAALDKIAAFEKQNGEIKQEKREAVLVQKIDNVASTIVNKLQSNPEVEQRAKAHTALRNHFKNLEPLTREERDLVDGTTPGGADVVKQLYAESIRRAAAYVSPVVNLVTTADASALYKVNRSDDTGRYHRYVVAGDESVSANAVDPTVSSTVSGDLDSLVANQIISYQALADIKDVAAFIQRNFSESLVRAVSLAILTGKDKDGNVLPNSTAGGLIASSASAGTTTTLGALTYADIVTGLFGSVNLQYFNNGTLLVAPSTYTYLLSQVDSTGRPLYKVHPDGVLRIAGRSVFAATELDAVTVAGGTVALFGDFARAYTYGQGSTTTTTYRETFAERLEASVQSLHRMSGTAGVSAAVKKLVNHA